jgi:hypothetical protein
MQERVEYCEADKIATESTEQRADGEITLPLIAYLTNPEMRMRLVPAPARRDWMDQTDNRFAYRCLPMVIANQAGWFILGNCNIAAIWNGGPAPQDIMIKNLSGVDPCPALSTFGSGIITWTMPFLFRTTPGYNLTVRGPTNWPKDGVCALEGIVETDWTEASFTMNWKITRPHHEITFTMGEPIAMVVPQPRAELEIFGPEIRDLAADPALRAAYLRWSESRRQFNLDLRHEGSEARKQGWQKHYMQGRSITSKRALEHQNKLELHQFADRTAGSEVK